MMKWSKVIAGCAALLLTLACGGKQRCKADLSLAEACADGYCPADLNEAVAKAQACEAPYFELWREGDHRALGVAAEGVVLYYFEGNQLVGRESADDQLSEDPCPSLFVNGARSLNRYDDPRYNDSSTVEYCVACEQWVHEGERPLCTAEQLGVE
jgi:hypothetical protein